MENNQKWVNMSFFAGAALMAFIVFLLANKVAAAMDFEGRVSGLETYIKVGAIVVGAALYLILNQNRVANKFMDEVFIELGKVTWPVRDETMKGTIAVLVAVTVMGFMFGVVDWLWSVVVGWVM